jgi:signal transduction histidine kinase
VEQLVFRTAREARATCSCTRAGEVALEAAAHDGGVRLAVQDDGRGVGPEAAARAGDTAPTALQLLAERAAELGGRLATESARGGGTRSRARVPGG